MTPHLLAIFMVVIAMVSIQGGAALAKQLFPVLGPQGTTLLRLVFATIMLSCIWQPWKARFTRTQWRHVLAYGITLGGMNLLIYLALAHIPLGIAVAIEFMGPLGVALAASRKPLDFVWAALAAAGVLLLLPITPLSQPLSVLGVLYAAGAGLCWALYIIFGQRAGNAAHAGMITTWGMSVGMVVAIPFGVAEAGTHLLNLSVWPIALGVALFSSAIPYTLEMAALKRLPTRTFGILMSLEPAIAALSGLILLHEYLATIQWLAIGLIIAASLGSSAKAKPLPVTPEANV